MLLLPAAALCCLCSALVAMAVELVQEDLTLTRKAGQSVSFGCGTDQCSAANVFWYQKKESETFRVILNFDRNTGKTNSDLGHPQKADFSAVKTQRGWELKIERVKEDHSATYYCSCLFLYQSSSLWYYIFGSGSKLYVTDKQVVNPVVSVYPAASTAHQEGSSPLLCVASDMFPPLVRFSWKRQKKNSPLEDVPPAEGEQVELRESGRSASITVVHRLHLDTYTYSCSVKHEGGTVEAQTQAELPAPAASCPPEREPAELPAPADSPPADSPPADFFQSQCRVKLLCLLYTVLIVKSLVYCCGLSLLMILRKQLNIC
ncbi:immunoglobulin lambda-1 light chain-like [Cololabis saira]|uniref:immunoglobulin lambda-1 light chain-like n=1 Tax=Cololabis saira TaxID=129043 RepID=UPI002AD5402F|nr:immunoglobulin lambda-1 light chain-like [Cololabis saira]